MERIRRGPEKCPKLGVHWDWRDVKSLRQFSFSPRRSGRDMEEGSPSSGIAVSPYYGTT